MDLAAIAALFALDGDVLTTQVDLHGLVGPDDPEAALNLWATG
ncbi:hypothetical protein ACIBI3_42115 [Actinomadura luteofluorescens]